MGDVEFIPVELPDDELNLRWSELIKKLLEIDDKLQELSSKGPEEEAA
jgi:hypothetical protein